MDKDIRHIAKTISALSSTELNELTYVLMEKHDMSATIYRFGVIPDVETSVDEQCDLVLLDCGQRKLMVVKLLKELLGLGLKDAKHIADDAPCFMKKNMDVEEADKMKKDLESIGATTEIRYHD